MGEKHPFGDDEIIRIARCFTYLHHCHHPPNQQLNHNHNNDSFLTKWAVHCSTLPKPNFDLASSSASHRSLFVNLLQVDPNLVLDDTNIHDDAVVVSKEEDNYETKDPQKMFNHPRMQKTIRNLLSEIETHILPPNFGPRLEETVFTLLSPMPLDDFYNTIRSTTSSTSNASSNTTQSTIIHTTEEAMTMQRLDTFLNGLANSSRRGSRKALEVLFHCCCCENGSNVLVASAKKLIDLAYRLALASLVIDMVMNPQKYGENNEDNDNDDDDNDDNDNMKNKYEKIKEKNTGENEHRDNDNNIPKETTTHNAIETEYDLTPYYPQEVNQSLVQSLYDFASNYHDSSTMMMTMGGSNYSSFQKTQGSTNIYGHENKYHSSTTTTTTTTTTTQSDKEKERINKDGEDSNDGVTLEAFMTWAESNAPCISATMETFIHRIFFMDKPYPPSRTEFMFPLLKSQHSAFFQSKKSSPLLFTLASMSPSLGGEWFRLYTSDEDGLSFNRLQNSLLGYSGPTLLIIKEVEGGGIFGAFTSTAWKENKDFYGNSDCFLFQLQPNVQVIRPRGGRGGTNFMYCNSESRSRGYDGQAHGIGFGGTVEKPRLFIAESFDGCMASASDLTFESGALLAPLRKTNSTHTMDTLSPTMTSSRKYFDIESLEVWGVGGDEIVAAALGARRQQREIKAANIRKARKVDKAAFLDDLKSGLIESKAFKVCVNFIFWHVQFVLS